MVREGVECIGNIRARYDGEKRNPWDEAECGHHYARAMAAWSGVLALSGFRYHGRESRRGRDCPACPRASSLLLVDRHRLGHVHAHGRRSSVSRSCTATSALQLVEFCRQRRTPPHSTGKPAAHRTEHSSSHAIVTNSLSPLSHRRRRV